MINEDKLRQAQIWFIILACVINLLTYTLLIGGGNLFQQYSLNLHLAANIYPKYSLIGFRIMIALTALSLLTKFQQLNYQRVLMSVLVLAIVPLPVSLDTFPIITGIGNAINGLSQAWLQLYVPPALRATISGILTGLSGVINIRSAAVEQYWHYSVIHEHVITVIMAIGLIFFWKLSLTLKNIKISDEPIQEKPETIRNLITKYHYVFITCLMLGFNQGIFFFTLMLGSEALPNEPPQTYQYVIYTAAIISPMIIGRLADIYGIRFMTMFSAIFLTICNFLNVALSVADIGMALPYYIVAFIQSSLAASFWALACSLVGVVLRTKGIFRSFAISNIVINLGVIVCGRVYEHFTSFKLTMLAMGIINMVFLVFLWVFYKKSEN